ncbi:hypothetical protein VOLCADRAFT_97759 [Volvox carteri f. nagariensis]|uniref:PI3K/PI4K catalytic domain-containing protein n=1 Tax=Volvox carteri f. nagariensis TaxID=3068 RepID=D8UDK1_VOLCA|nr:uncharacterized protein VOLCADRAFT_97759 [Volvox carteri f. nagariensis]EFJ42178.1 hypothetical protein VOLCADRAFT_97759 [Volvox carteri f. nagariensis]|eukprot:XP_002956721.1 hypothetical protein VOLCADRAFT_97759 [Volvox carteri f. nagariensis]
MLAKALGFRHLLSWSRCSQRGRQAVAGRGLSHPPLISAAPVVDIGSVPIGTDGLLQHLHERCTAADQPFCWRTTGIGAETSANGTASLDASVSCSTGALNSQSVLRTTSPQAGRDSADGISRPELREPRQVQSSLASGEEACSPSDSAPMLEVDEHCLQTHPGSICCTSTAVEKDATHNSCIVTLKTSVKVTDPRLHVASAELEELAWLAARDAATAAVSALNRQGSLSAGRQERHRFVCNMLRNGTIRDAKRMENGFGHVSYLVTLEDKATGQKMRAAFKPRVEGDCEGWHRVPIEVAAYQLNLMLGMDVVPPAVMRGDCDVDWTHYPQGGAFIYWCSGARQLNTVPMPEWSVAGPLLLSDTRILDVLIQNSDRHAGHFLYAEHWADGDYTPAPHPQGRSSGGTVWRGRMSPVLIDHAAGFRQDAFVCLDHQNAFLTGMTWTQRAQIRRQAPHRLSDALHSHRGSQLSVLIQAMRTTI